MFHVSAKVIAHSKSSVTGKEIATFELEFPRVILAEWNTHNALSKNASSSRAIPVPTMLKQIRENPAFLARFGAANKGMQDNGVHHELVTLRHFDHAEFTAEGAWAKAGQVMADFAEDFHNSGYAKQVCNRLIEPWQMMKVVMTATELNNFLWLRDHDAADPTIAALARVIKEAYKVSWATVLNPGEWHVPYYNNGYWKHADEPLKRYAPKLDSDGVWGEVEVDSFGHSLEHAQIISASCCAQVSYRKLDDTIEKALGVVARLNLQGEEPDQPVHASPLEHIATPIKFADSRECMTAYLEGNHDLAADGSYWPEGVTHVDRDGQFGSGNLKGFIQYRQLVPNHVKRG